MALKSVPGIDLESLPEEARSLIEGTRAEGAGCRPPHTKIGCCGNARAREAQEVWPEEREAQLRTDRALGARAWSPRAGGRKGIRGLFGAKGASRSASMPGATPCPSICHGARRGSACAAERSAAA